MSVMYIWKDIKLGNEVACELFTYNSEWGDFAVLEIFAFKAANHFTITNKDYSNIKKAFAKLFNSKSEYVRIPFDKINGNTLEEKLNSLKEDIKNDFLKSDIVIISKSQENFV